MPVNVTLGSTVKFTAAFLDANQVLFVPSSASVTVTYPLSSNSLVSAATVIPMTISGQVYIATWGTGVAALGLTSYSVSGAQQATPTTGQLRLTT